MSLINDIYLFVKGSICFKCKHQNVCKFTNSIGMKQNITTGCSNKKEVTCKNKKEEI